MRYCVPMVWGRLLAGITLGLAGPQASPDSWRIDSNHSAAYFSVRHLMINTVRGSFGGIVGVVHYDPHHIDDATVEATIDCATVTIGVAKRDSQMKGPDFFDIKKYPAMRFKSKRVQKVDTDKLKVRGDLTINATTHEVVLDVDGPSQTVKDAQGREKIGLNATTKISRKEYGIVWNEILETGGVAVADEVTITLDIEMLKGEK